MGGKKRSIPIVEIENKQTKSVSFTKRRKGLFSKATKLCLLSPNTQIAILATPPSSKSHASFYSFGHSSVDHVVSSLLQDQSPLPTYQPGFWWEDERFDKLDNVDELKEASSAVSRMLNNVRLRLDYALKKEKRDNRALVIHQQKQEKEVLQLCNTTNSTNEETMNQVPDFGGALVIHEKKDQEKKALQICNTNQNDNEETMNQIPKFGGASGSGSGFESLLENDEDALHIDALMSDCQFVPL